MHCYRNWEKSGTQCRKWNMINCSSEPILTVIEINLFLNFKSNSKSIRKKTESMWWAAEQTAWFKQQRAYQAHAWFRQAQDRQQLILLIGGGCRTQGSTLRIQATSLKQVSEGWKAEYHHYHHHPTSWEWGRSVQGRRGEQGFRALARKRMVLHYYHHYLFYYLILIRVNIYWVFAKFCWALRALYTHIHILP